MYYVIYWGNGGGLGGFLAKGGEGFAKGGERIRNYEGCFFNFFSLEVKKQKNRTENLFGASGGRWIENLKAIWCSAYNKLLSNIETILGTLFVYS